MTTGQTCMKTAPVTFRTPTALRVSNYPCTLTRHSCLVFQSSHFLVCVYHLQQLLGSMEGDHPQQDKLTAVWVYYMHTHTCTHIPWNIHSSTAVVKWSPGSKTGQTHQLSRWQSSLRVGGAHLTGQGTPGNGAHRHTQCMYPLPPFLSLPPSLPPPLFSHSLPPFLLLPSHLTPSLLPVLPLCTLDIHQCPRWQHCGRGMNEASRCDGCCGGPKCRGCGRCTRRTTKGASRQRGTWMDGWKGGDKIHE